MATKTVSLNVNTREIAQQAREFARQHGQSVGTRGRLSRETFVRFLMTQPATVREIARQAGIPVGVRGRIRPEVAEQVAILVR